jgi:hypothetical protein
VNLFRIQGRFRRDFRRVWSTALSQLMMSASFTASWVKNRVISGLTWTHLNILWLFYANFNRKLMVLSSERLTGARSGIS